MSSDETECATSLYPELRSSELLSAPTVTESQIIRLIDKGKQKDRIRYMKDKQNDLNLKLKHYEKVKHNWVVFRRIFEGLGIAVTASLSVAAIVFTAGTFSIPLIPVILTGGGLAATAIITPIDKAVFKKREKSLQQKEFKIKEIIDKLHYYFEKCREDNIITLEEIEAFDKIVKESYLLEAASSAQEPFLEELSAAMLQTLVNMPQSPLSEKQKRKLKEGLRSTGSTGLQKS